MIPGGRSSSIEPPFLSAIIPALDEEQLVPAVLGGLGQQGDLPGLEVVLADGGSVDRTVERFQEATVGWAARGWKTRVVRSRAGRAAQMNAGAREAAGEVLLFLHADTRLPAEATQAVASALRDPKVVGGGFRHRFSEPGLRLRIISAWATARSWLWQIHYGDQAIFVRRSIFEALGGFPEVALFEDLRLSRALRARAQRAGGRVVTLPLAAETSARRLIAGGVLRTSARFSWLKLRHALGADPGALKDRYRDVR